MLKLKKNEAEAYERLDAFWRGKSIGRPAIIARAKNSSYDYIHWDGPVLSQKQQDLCPDYYVWKWRNNLFGSHYLGEAMPMVFADHGSSITLLAVLAGGDYEYDGSAWTQPKDNILNTAVPKFNPNCETVIKLEQSYKAMHEMVDGFGLLSPPSMIDALTTLSMLHTQESLCMSILEEPENVKSWTHDATTLYIDCYDHFYKVLSKMGHTTSSAWLGIAARGRMEAVQCDFGVMLSPEMYKEFVMPDLARITSYLDYSTYHLDGVEQMRFIDMIASLPNINAIQWNPAVFDFHPSEHMASFKRIKEFGLSLSVSVRNIDDAKYLVKSLGSDGLMLVFPYFDCEEDALAAIKEMTMVTNAGI